MFLKILGRWPLLLFPVCFFLLASDLYPQRVLNETQHFESVEFKLFQLDNANPALELVLRNGYTQNVTAFTIAVDDLRVIAEFIISEDGTVIAPTTDYKMQVPLGPTYTSPKTVTILAIVLADGTGDGNPSAVEEIRNQRLGRQLQLSRILPLLQSAIDVPETEIRASLQVLKNRVSALADTDNTFAVRGGLLAAKQDIITKIDRLETAQQMGADINVREKLIKIRDQSHETLTKIELSRRRIGM